MKNKIITLSIIAVMLFGVVSAYTFNGKITQITEPKIPINESVITSNKTEIVNETHTSVSETTTIDNNRIYIAFYPGDANDDGQLDIADPVFINNFLAGKARCTSLKQLAQMDVNQDGKVTLADSKYLLKYLFNNGKSPKTNSITLHPYLLK